MAYASVVSLNQILDQIHSTDRLFNLGDDQSFQIFFLSAKVQEIIHFLGNPSQSNSKEVKLWETKIRDVAYHAEDVIESWQMDLQKKARKIDSNMEEEDANIIDSQKVITEICTLVEEMVKIKDGSGKKNVRSWPSLISSSPAPSGQTTMVGFGEDLMQIKDRLCNEKPSTRQIIPILGMGGIGKTTLAKNVYNDSLVAYHFYICAWISLSQQYRIREILLSFLDDIGVLTDEMRKESDEHLKEYTYKGLKGKRYLIVMDDVWSTDAWNEIQMLFPDDNNGSRILLTTRLTHVAEYISSTNLHHRMRFLTEEESWNLFQKTVFGEENCPSELVGLGMNIAKNCQGLPLLIVVVAGLLVKKPLDYWVYVAVNFSSIVAEKDEHCSKILALSYNNLPPHLKPCFLYMGVFPDNYEIPVSRLVKLWVAEGFINPDFTGKYWRDPLVGIFENQDLYEVAEKYLMDLIGRNLILVGQKRSVSGKIKTCRMHDLLRELCVRIAHEENFLYVKSRYHRALPEEASFKRRLCINDDASYSDSEEDISMQSMDLVRSFIYNGWDETRLHSYYYFGCRLLRVLDMIGVELTKFPEEILLLVNLRYIAIACHNAVIPASITILWNLQILIVEDPTGIASELPTEIWYMGKLRHLRFSRVFLPPSIDRSRSLLQNLESLSVLDNLYYDTKLPPNLKKLGIHYNNESSQLIKQFLQLKKLESLKILFDSPSNSTFIYNTWPSSLKKITLERGRMDWKYMRIFGSLPNLEVLKLREFAFQGSEWVPNEGEFLKLKFLLISETDLVHMRADSTHFPCLEHLILRNCSNLVEIPPDIGEILTLQIIEIDYSSPSAMDSAKIILDYQRSRGNDDLQVFVHPTKTKVYLKFGIEQDESGRFYRRKTKLKAIAKSGSSSNP